ncbi:unnamed protein product, partial [Iphiclides podalirius]
MLHFVFFAVVALVSADVIFDGPCPEVKPVENFNFSAYQGKWYEIAKFPNAGEEQDRGKCTTAEYTVDGDKGSAKNSHLINNVNYYINAELTLVGPAQVRLNYTFDGKTKFSYLTILDTDYKSYSIGYSCKYFKDNNKHQVFSWIKSRSKSLEGAAKEAVENYLKKSNVIDTSKYVKNDFSDEVCKEIEAKEITSFLN